jgi:hypothetical protein
MNEPKQELIQANENFHVVNRAEIDCQIATAKQYPRRVRESYAEALSMVTMDQETAESCMYCLPRGNKPIKGSSVRLAEIAAYSWGNLHAATRITGNDGRFVTAEAVAWDLEKNIKITVEKKRSIRGKDGKTYNADMQTVTANAAASIALRDAIFKVIPKNFINKLYDEAVKCALGDVKSLAQRRDRVLSYFSKLGITLERVLTTFQVAKIEDIDQSHLELMIGTANSIKDGSISVENAFPDPGQELSMPESAQDLNRMIFDEKK